MSPLQLGCSAWGSTCLIFPLCTEALKSLPLCPLQHQCCRSLAIIKPHLSPQVNFVKMGGVYRTRVFAGVRRDLIKCVLCPSLEANQTLPVSQMKRNYTPYEFQCLYSHVSKGPFRIQSAKHRDTQSVREGVVRKQV